MGSLRYRTMDALRGDIVEAPLSRSLTKVGHGLPVQRERIYLRVSPRLTVAAGFAMRTRRTAALVPYVTISSIGPFKACTMAALRLDIVDALPSWPRCEVGRGLPMSRQGVWLHASLCKLAGQPRTR